MDDLTPADPGRIGPYQIAARLGESVSAIVYLGRSTRGQAVVVKLVRDESANDESIRRKLISGLEDRPATVDPAIPAVLRSDLTAWPPWIATEYEPGSTLAEAIERFGPLPPSALRLLARGLLKPLRFLHHQRLSHGAVTPTNVLLTEAGPKLLDLGIALSAGAQDDRAAFGAVLRYAAGDGHPLPVDVQALTSEWATAQPQVDSDDFHGWLPQDVTIAALQDARAALLIEARSAWRSPHERAAVRPLVGHGTGPARRAGQPAAIEPETQAAQEGGQDSEHPRRLSRRRLLAIGGGLAALLGAGAAATAIEIDRGNQSDPARWSVDVGDSVTGAVLAVPSAGLLLATTLFDNILVALDLTTGAKRWDLRAKSSASEWFVVNEDKLLVCLDGSLHAIDLVTGMSDWTVDGFGFADVTSDGERAYVVGGETITAVDLRTRAIAWSVSSEYSVSRGATIFGDTVLLGMGTDATCLDARTGKKLWSYDLKTYLGAAPVGADGLAWLGTRVGDLVAFDARTGAVRYKLLTSDSGAGSGDAQSRVAVANGIAVVGTTDFVVYGVETATGTIRWTYRTAPRSKYDSGIDSSPVIDNGTVYIGSGAEDFLALDLMSGQLKWRFRTAGKVKIVNSSPAVHGDMVYFGSFDDHIYAVNKITGRP